MENATTAIDTDELPFSKTQVDLEKAVHNLPKGRPRNCCRNAFHRIKRAWSLRLLDPEIAVFSAITAEEEAASAVISALKTKGYSGADILNPRSHPHKAGVIYMAQAVVRMLR